MITHYFKIAIRNLSKQKGLAFINIFGLAVGLACFILFMLYAVNEFSFDRFHKKAPNIFHVYLKVEASGEEQASAISYQAMPLGPAMKRDLPDVVHAIRIREG